MPNLGEGNRVQALTETLGRRKGVKNPKALATWIGRRKGKKSMQRIAAK